MSMCNTHCTFCTVSYAKVKQSPPWSTWDEHILLLLLSFFCSFDKSMVQRNFLINNRSRIHFSRYLYFEHYVYREITPEIGIRLAKQSRYFHGLRHVNNAGHFFHVFIA